MSRTTTRLVFEPTTEYQAKRCRNTTPAVNSCDCHSRYIESLYLHLKHIRMPIQEASSTIAQTCRQRICQSQNRAIPKLDTIICIKSIMHRCSIFPLSLSLSLSLPLSPSPTTAVAFRWCAPPDPSRTGFRFPRCE